MASGHKRGFILLFLFTLVGCTTLPIQIGGDTPTAQLVTPTTTPAAPPSASIVPPLVQETASNPTLGGGKLLRIWLPPEFNPDGNMIASQLLRDRLAEFASLNPEVRLEVRVKAADGVGGLLDALVAANAAAPLTLPDLALLPRSLLESAALKGLLYPYNDLTNLMDDPEWFEYARQLAQLKNNTYGIPFAGDALVLAYHPSQMATYPANLEEMLSLGKVLLFPATDPQALFPLSLYLAAGKGLQDDQGRPALDEATLTGIFEFVQSASLAGVMPYWLTQYSNDAQIWEVFMGNEHPMAVAWASTYIQQLISATDNLAMAPLPTLNGTAYSLATGWSWVLTGQDPVRREVSIRLAEFMVETDFLVKWTQAAGYLPPRLDALQNWQPAGLRDAIEQISSSARLMPPADVLSSLGPALEQAVVDVLKSQGDPQSAARSVIRQVIQP